MSDLHANNSLNAPTLENRIASWAARPRPWIVLIALMILFQFKWWWTPTPDSVLYCSNARAMLHGKMERLGSRQLVQPPGYPLLIAPSFLFGDQPWTILTLNQMVLLAAVAAAIWLWFKPIIGPATPLLTALVMANLSIWRYSRMNLSEPPTMFWMLLAAISLDRTIRCPDWPSRLLWAVIGGLLAGMAGLTRIVGVSVALGMGLALLLRAFGGNSPWPRSLILATIIGALGLAGPVGFLLYDHAHEQPGGRDYLFYLADKNTNVITTFIEGMRLRISEIGGLMLPGMYKARSRPGVWLHINIAIYLTVCAIMIRGLWRVLRKRPEPMILGFPAFFIICSIYAYPSVTRYMLPVLPVLIAGIWFGLEGLKRHRHTLMLILLIGHLGVSIGHRLTTIGDELALHRRWPAVLQIMEPLKNDRREIGAAGFETEFRMFMVWSIDRKIVEIADASRIDPRIHWLLIKPGDPVPPGFHERSANEFLKLLERG